LVNAVLRGNGLFKGPAVQFLVKGYALLNGKDSNPAGGVLS
jgi:hypothetical protein